MLAAAARESHRSPSARQLLSPERSPPEERQVVEESVAESIVGGGGGHDGGHDGGAGGAGGAGMAASEADVGNIDSLVRASLSEERKSSSGARNKPAARGRSAARSSGRVRPSNSKGAAEGGVVPKSSAPATKEGGGEEQAGDELSIVSTGSLAKTPSSKRLSTERSKQLYNIHQRTQEKLKAKREKSATAGCTFAPQLSSKQKGRKLEAGSAYDHLYQHSLKQRQRRERMVKEEGNKLSFQPVLPTASSRLAAKTTVVSAAAGHQRAEKKSKATAEAMYSNCTFTPNRTYTQAVTNKILAARGEQVPLVDRLYVAPATQAALIKRREEARASLELGACTFRPNTTPATPKGASKRISVDSGGELYDNIHDRLFYKHGEELMRKKFSREKYAKNELKECTFSPALISKSISSKAKTGELPGDGGKAEPVYERLYTPRGRSRDYDGFVDPECTFQPNLSLTNRSAAAVIAGRRAQEEGDSVPRVEAMYTKAKIKQTERSQSPKNYEDTFRKRDEDKELDLCTFQPNVSQTAGSPYKAESRGKDLFNTLYGHKQDFATAKERVRMEAMKDCTFTPELTSQKTHVGRSMSPSRSRPVHEELYMEATTQRIARTLSAENLQATQCPFKPKLIARSNPRGPGAKKSSIKPTRAAPGAEMPQELTPFERVEFSDMFGEGALGPPIEKDGEETALPPAPAGTQTAEPPQGKAGEVETPAASSGETMTASPPPPPAEKETEEEKEGNEDY